MTIIYCVLFVGGMTAIGLAGAVVYSAIKDIVGPF